MKLQLRAGTNFHEIIVCFVCIGWSARAMATGLRHEGGPCLALLEADQDDPLSPGIQLLQPCLIPRRRELRDIVVTMINAVLVFNNNGEPRLTKFYTQIVRLLNPSEEGKSIPTNSSHNPGHTSKKGINRPNI